ncbi:MAG TPA: tetratricopeptide repeat protein [Candidatus Polarisedimenticolaceae bacterium]|nr:tetratricopeptide repeat protein [Candidatus Polarisedimenticolaceae bacterium]
MRQLGWLAGIVFLYWVAALCYRPWVHKKPDLSAAYLRLAADDVRRGRLDQAIREGEVAVRVNPSHAIAHYNLGCYLLDAGRLDDAEREFQEVLRLEPGADLARMQLRRLREVRARGR